jgi:hypothetical protein
VTHRHLTVQRSFLRTCRISRSACQRRRSEMLRGRRLDIHTGPPIDKFTYAERTTPHPCARLQGKGNINTPLQLASHNHSTASTRSVLAYFHHGDRCGAAAWLIFEDVAPLAVRTLLRSWFSSSRSAVVKPSRRPRRCVPASATGEQPSPPGPGRDRRAGATSPRCESTQLSRL